MSYVVSRGAFRLSLLAIAAAVLMGLVPEAGAQQTFFTNMGPADAPGGGSFDPNSNLAIGTGSEQAIALRFVAAASGLAGRVDMAVRSSSGAALHVEIREHNASTGTPSNIVLGGSDFVPSPTSGIQSVTFSGASGPAALVTGRTYWLVARYIAPSPTNNAVWHPAVPSQPATLAIMSQSFGPEWMLFNGLNQPAARVVSSTTLGACCSPINGACRVLDVSECTALGMTSSPGAACTPGTPPLGTCSAPCPADFNRAGGVTIQDVFDFLTAWFAGC